jgi:hypothetical protein
VADSAKAKEYEIDKIPALAIIGKKIMASEFTGYPTVMNFKRLLNQSLTFQEVKLTFLTTPNQFWQKSNLQFTFRCSLRLLVRIALLRQQQRTN